MELRVEQVAGGGPVWLHTLHAVAHGTAPERERQHARFNGQHGADEGFGR